MKKMTSIFLALSLILNVLLGVVLVYQNYSTPVAEAFNEIKSPGTYGPPTMEVIDGDTAIKSADVVLQNTLITGNLYLTADILSGTVTLDQVEVQGEVMIAGGGEYQLLVTDSTLAKITVMKNDGVVEISAKGDTVIKDITVEAEASLVEDGLSGSAEGFQNTVVNTDKKVLLIGEFTTLEVEEKSANVKILRGAVANLRIKETAANARTEFAQAVRVESMIMEAPAVLEGNGNVQSLLINASGLVRLQGILGEVTCRGEGIFLELTAGSMDKLIVSESELATSISMAQDTTVVSMELNGRTGVTGQGTVGTVIINCAGVTVDQVPQEIVLAEGLSAMIGGEEYREQSQEDDDEGEEEPEPEPEPEPTIPTVHLAAINDVEFIDFGQTKTITLSFTPGAKISISDTSVADISLSGDTLTITANKQGTAAITVTAAMDGYYSRKRTFDIAVDPIAVVYRKTSQDETFIPPDKCLILVALHNNDPGKYRVMLSNGEELEYDSEVGGFMLMTDIDNLNSAIKVAAAG